MLAATATSALGTITSTYANYQQAQAEAGVAKMNRDRENERVVDAIARGREDERTLGREQSRFAGAQRAAMAANGIDLSFGSAADMLADTAQFQSEDRAKHSRNVIREVEGYDISAANFEGQRRAAKAAGTAALISGGLELGQTLAGGATRYKKMEWNRRQGGNPWG